MLWFISGKTDNKILKEVVSLKNEMESNLDEFKFREALKNLIGIARIGNKHLADNEPWKIKSENPERVEQILKTSFEIVSYLAVLSEPFSAFCSSAAQRPACVCQTILASVVPENRPGEAPLTLFMLLQHALPIQNITRRKHLAL